MYSPLIRSLYLCHNSWTPRNRHALLSNPQDADLCLSLSMAQMFMKLASLAWLCCCCHHALTVFRASSNLMPVPETNMGKSLARYR